MKTRAAAAVAVLGLACGGFAINDGAASAAPTSPAVGTTADGAVQTDALTLVFKDNFNGSRLSSAWHFRNARAPQRQCSVPDSRLATVKNGKLLLSVRRDASKKPNVTRRCPNGQFLNAMIATSKTFGYGRYSARIKFHRPKGAHGSFWLQSSSTEVDTIEYFGKPGSKGGGLRSYVHRPSGDNTFITSGGALKASKVRSIIGNHYASDAFHTYTVDWTPSAYTFSIDGKVTLRVKGAISKQPVFLVMSLLTSDYEIPALKYASLPFSMQVDWVKVWKR